MTAGVLLKVEPEEIRTVLQELRKIEGVKYAYGVFGRYDVVVMIEAESLEQLTSIVVDKIGAIEGITSTETLIKADI